MNNNIDNNTILRYCENLSFHQLIDLAKDIHKKRDLLYPPNHKKEPVKYGNLSKFLKEEDFEDILSLEYRQRIKLAYKFMYHMGLRISEVVEIKTTDIIDNDLIIRNIKSSRNDSLRIPKRLKKEIEIIIKENIDLIKKNKNYLFFSNNNNKTRYNVSKDWLRNNWRKLTIKAEINKIYDKSKERFTKDKNGKKRVNRNLYLFSSHALRHSFGQRIYNKCKDPEITRIAMRHNDIATTMGVYCRGNLEEVNHIIEEL